MLRFVNSYLKNIKSAGISQIIIERNSKRTEVFIYSSRPGLIIGQSGTEIEKVKKEVSKLVNENIQISVVEIKNPDMVAQLVADSIAHAIENRVSFRVAQKKAIRNTMKAGAKGIKTLGIWSFRWSRYCSWRRLFRRNNPITYIKSKHRLCYIRS